jgi:hypothetical protein
MAPTIITLLYPTSTTKPFDAEYYTTSHMPLGTSPPPFLHLFS